MKRALFVFVSLASLAGCRGWESDQPPVHLIPNMDTQEKGRPYRRDDSGLFADGRVMQAPPEGTVSTEEFIDDDLMTSGKGADGQFAAAYPASIKLDDAALAARGRSRMDVYCSPCHGINGDGDGAIAKRGGLLVPPPSFHDERLKTMPAGQIYAAIRDGVNNQNMPSYAAQIPERDRWAVVLAVRNLQRERDQGVKLEGGAVVAVVADKASAEVGAKLFVAKGCTACHTVDGTKKVGPPLNGIYGKKEGTSAGEITVDDAYLVESLLQPMAKIVNGYPPAMPPLPLTEVEQQSLVLYIKSLK